MLQVVAFKELSCGFLGIKIDLAESLNSPPLQFERMSIPPSHTVCGVARLLGFSRNCKIGFLCPLEMFYGRFC